MRKKARAPKKAWSTLLDDNRDIYKHARPKRAVFILDYLERHRSLFVNSYHELGAFSGKDIKYLKARLEKGGFYASDLDVFVTGYLGKQGISALACDAFSLPFKDNAFDLSFHSGLIICFDNDDAFRIVKEQLRVTGKVAFVFAHNELSWIDKVAAFYKRFVRGRDIFNYRRFSERELKEMADKLGVVAEFYYVDNAFINFVGRNFPLLGRRLSVCRLLNNNRLFNEIVMVVRK